MKLPDGTAAISGQCGQSRKTLPAAARKRLRSSSAILIATPDRSPFPGAPGFSPAIQHWREE